MLSLDLENHIVKWIIACIGYRQTQSDILNKVQELVTKLKILTPFTDGQPLHKWYQLFMARHPDLHAKMANVLSCEQCQVSYNNFLYWFQELDEYLKEVGKCDVLEDLTHIYNVDKSRFPLVPKSKKVIALKTDKHVYQGGMTSNKMQITILIAASASGHCEAACCLSRCSTMNSVAQRFS